MFDAVNMGGGKGVLSGLYAYFLPVVCFLNVFLQQRPYHRFLLARRRREEKIEEINA